MTNIPLGTIAVHCPACDRGDQFITTGYLRPETPGENLIECKCGAVTLLSVLRANTREKAISFAAETFRRALGELKK